MRSTMGWAVILTAACESVTTSGGPSPGPEQPTPTSTTSTTSPVVTVGVGGSGAGGSSGVSSASSAATGGMGGGTTTTKSRTITVETYDGDPELGVDVIGHDGDGGVLEHTTTDASGLATVVATDDGMITVSYEISRQTPDGLGNVETTTRARTFTLPFIGAGTSFAHRTFEPRDQVDNPPMTLQVQSDVSGPGALIIKPTCFGQTTISNVGTSDVEVRGCPGESTFDVLVTSSFLQEAVYEDIPYAAGTTQVIDVTDAHLTPPSTVLSFDRGASIWGYDEHQQFVIQAQTPIGPSAPYTVGSPPTGNVLTWMVREVVVVNNQFSRRQRFLSSLPLTSTWTPTGIGAIENLTSMGPTNPPQATWSYGPGTQGDTTWVRWQDANADSWTVLLPATATTSVFPMLPEALATRVPAPSGWVSVFPSLGPSPAEVLAHDYTTIEFGPDAFDTLNSRSQ